MTHTDRRYSVDLVRFYQTRSDTGRSRRIRGRGGEGGIVLDPLTRPDDACDDSDDGGGTGSGDGADGGDTGAPTLPSTYRGGRGGRGGHDDRDDRGRSGGRGGRGGRSGGRGGRGGRSGGRGGGRGGRGGRDGDARGGGVLGYPFFGGIAKHKEAEWDKARLKRIRMFGKSGDKTDGGSGDDIPFDYSVDDAPAEGGSGGGGATSKSRGGSKPRFTTDFQYSSLKSVAKDSFKKAKIARKKLLQMYVECV